MPEGILYRIIFTQGEKVYELYSKYLAEDSLMGFVEIEDIVFESDFCNKNLVNPEEEKLKQIFNGVKRSYIPLHNILRVDEVVQNDSNKKQNGKSDNVHRIDIYLNKSLPKDNNPK